MFTMCNINNDSLKLAFFFFFYCKCVVVKNEPIISAV